MFRDVDLRWLWVLAVMLLVLLMAKCEAEAKDTFYGVGIFGGEQWQQGLGHTDKTYDWQEFQVRPMAGKHLTDRWDLWLEGNLGYIRWNDKGNGTFLGALVMTDYDLIKYKEWRFFTEMGVGLGWTNYTPSSHMLGNGVLGLVDIGMGIQYKNIRVGPRFEHKSAMSANDHGLNTYGLMITIRR